MQFVTGFCEKKAPDFTFRSGPDFVRGRLGTGFHLLFEPRFRRGRLHCYAFTSATVASNIYPPPPIPGVVVRISCGVWAVVSVNIRVWRTTIIITVSQTFTNHDLTAASDKILRLPILRRMIKLGLWDVIAATHQFIVVVIPLICHFAASKTLLRFLFVFKSFKPPVYWHVPAVQTLFCLSLQGNHHIFFTNFFTTEFPFFSTKCRGQQSIFSLCFLLSSSPAL